MTMHIESLMCFKMHNDSIFWFVILERLKKSRDAREYGTNREALLVKIKGLKVAKVLGILECIGSGLETHKHPNCQGLSAEASTLSTA